MPPASAWEGRAPQRLDVTLPGFQAFALSRPWAPDIPPARLPHGFPIWPSFSAEEPDCGGSGRLRWHRTAHARVGVGGWLAFPRQQDHVWPLAPDSLPTWDRDCQQAIIRDTGILEAADGEPRGKASSPP